MNHPPASPGPLLPAALAGLLLVLAAAGPVRAASDLKRGDVAPTLQLSDLEGRSIDTETWRGRVGVVIFGEAAQRRTRLAIAETAVALDTPRMADVPVEFLVVLARHSDPTHLRPTLAELPHPPVVAVDDERRAFGACRVSAVPTALIIDPRGRVVHVIAGHLERFGDIITDGLLLAAGRIDAERFERTLHPAEAGSDAERVRAERHTRFGVRLAGAGMPQLAEQKLREALELAPDHLPARLVLGDLLVRLGRLDEADAEYRRVLAARPDSIDAACGAALVQVLAGGEGVGRARELVEVLLRRSPGEARPHYVMGLIHEHLGETPAAAERFRRAAEILLRERSIQDIR